MTNETTTIEGWECYVDEDGKPTAQFGGRVCYIAPNGTMRYNLGLHPTTSVLRWLLAKHDELRGGFHVGKLLVTAAEQVAALKDGWRLRFSGWLDDWCALPSRNAVRTAYGSGDDHIPLEYWMGRGDSPRGEYWTIVGRQDWASESSEPAPVSTPTDQPRFRLGQTVSGDVQCAAAVREGWRLRWHGAGASLWFAQVAPDNPSITNDRGEVLQLSATPGDLEAGYTIVGRQWPEQEGAAPEPDTDEPTPDYPPANELDRLRERLVVGVLASGLFADDTPEDRADFADAEARALIAMRGK